MNLPHDIRFLTGEFFLRAWRKYGAVDQYLKAGRAASALETTITEILLGDRTKDRETELIDRVAEMEIYLSALITALGAQSDCKTAIQSRLDALTSEVLKR